MASSPDPAAAATAPQPTWEQRFRAVRVSLPDWAQDAPERTVYVSNATGTFEVYAWDRARGTHRQVTARRNGTSDATIDPSGQWIWWFDDTDGDEFGVWRRQPFEGGPDVAAAPTLPASYPAGLGLGPVGLAVVGRATEGRTTIHRVRADAEPVTLYEHTEDASVGALSRAPLAGSGPR